MLLPCTTTSHLTSPQYIGIHVRRKDFANWCGGVPVEDCFANITVIARRVREVKDELLSRKGLNVEHVIMTSDETDPQWWADVAAQGWLQVDHSMTVQMYGRWCVTRLSSAAPRPAVLTRLCTGIRSS
jgi:hypothetical protein